jgi:RNA polymerase sigma-70 factor (ECF subfamily)
MITRWPVCQAGGRPGMPTMSPEMSAVALLERAVAGDEEALETLLLQHFDHLAADIARRIPADVRGTLAPDDVVQDAFIVAFQRIREFQPQGDGAFLGWLARIAEHRLLDAVKTLRAAKRGGGWQRLADAHDPERTGLVPLLEMLPQSSRTPSRSAAVHEALTALAAAIEQLSPDYRDVLRLRFIESLPVADCAARMQRSEGAVHMLLGRALAALRARMGDTSRFFTRTT